MDKPQAWLEASLICSAELAEAVAEVFSRFTPDGVVLNNITRFDQTAYEEVPTGEIRVAAYLPLDESVEEKKHQLDQAIWHMSQIAPLSPLSYAQIADQDWMSLWKQHYKPLEIGKKLIVLPAWVDQSLAGERLPIRISPDVAFGTGSHPSTQLCLIALEKYGCKGLNVLDVGCGSGILSIAAVRLGANQVLGVDTDQASIPSADRNAALNGMENRVTFEVGTHTNLLNRSDQLRQAPRVLANILAPVLIKMLNSGLADTVSPSGLLILGGILDTQVHDVLNAAANHGLTMVEGFHDGDWVVLVLRKH
ncbi:MAG: 50S ribosomal protein L11 methyltransferase [Chloroflexi bacterium]|nr:50S ribosomal protein L11 methyltransferase [Chloroflexota bacterium]